ncbi:hypothetical protein ACFOUV_10585 [Oceanobacillus longus]|uniref:ABC transporter substrate-binding protein n=1 Tax=Oceanobacillus longus TaxID=930120 RepID=A0ABV8H1I3_9BACI
MKLKKLTFAMMIAILSAGLLVGCGAEDGENPEEPATEDPAEQEDPAESDVEEEEGE